jgi:hypothetical protein
MDGKRPTSLWFLALTLILMGCGGQSGLEFSTAQVEGTVTYRGKPLETGKIRFIPDGEVVDGKVAGQAVFADIKDGKYSIPAAEGVTVGKNRVEIKSYRGTGKMQVSSAGDGEKIEVVEQFIPDDYNSQSTLSAEIKAGENRVDLDLK